MLKMQPYFSLLNTNKKMYGFKVQCQLATDANAMNPHSPPQIINTKIFFTFYLCQGMRFSIYGNIIVVFQKHQSLFFEKLQPFEVLFFIGGDTNTRSKP